ncbi:hypothetical protein OAR97_04850 [Arcobacteraceae bacterium]|nr:hypothetical protein [Arcobacteraceae bacterium]
MNIRKKLLVIAIIGATSLLSADLNTINTMIDKINKTKALEAKEELMVKLNQEVEKLNRLDVIKAQEMIDKKLLQAK